MAHWTFNLDPNIFHIGSRGIRWYGMMYVLSMIISYIILKYHFIKKGLFKVPAKYLDNLITWTFVGMLLGSRTFYAIFYNFSYYKNHFWEIFAFWQGGLSFHGAVTGMAIGAAIYARRIKVPFLHIADHFCFCGAIGIFLGRIGNFINGELWGRVSYVPWAIIFPEGGPEPRHPSQLYESFFEGIVLSFILYFILKKQKHYGTTMFSFFSLYAVFRFFIEFYREPDAQLGFIFWGLSMGQILCAVMLIIILVIWKITRMRQKAAEE